MRTCACTPPSARKSVRSATVNCLRQVGIPHPDRYVDCYPHQLSGGMRQRVVIAVALCCRPRLLIADEPTTALDVTVQAEILRLFDRLQGESGMAVILVTHDLSIAANHTDEVAVMYGGRIVEHAPTSVLFSRMRHPYTQALMAAVPRLDAPDRRTLQDDRGTAAGSFESALGMRFCRPVSVCPPHLPARRAAADRLQQQRSPVRLFLPPR